MSNSVLQRAKDISLRSKVSLTVGLVALSGAVSADPITDLIAEVDLAGVATAIAGVAAIIIIIALGMKAPSVVKRLIGKI